MSQTLISSFPEKHWEPKSRNSLYVSEFFYDTIQGENFVGYPAAFLRLQGCTLSCVWCDTKEVWMDGNPYEFYEILELIESSGLHERLKDGQHLVITGGSPLRQQFEIVMFLNEFLSKFRFTPYIEIENECVIRPLKSLRSMVSCWNNSPKLSSSGNSKVARYKPTIIKEVAQLTNSWFKFVVTSAEDWHEIELDYLDTALIRKDQIVLMPEGQDKETIMKNAPFVVDLAIKYNVRYTSREHIVLWDKAIGV